jgi:hypothetical protein
MPRKTRNLLTAKLKRAKRLSTVLFHNVFLTLSNTLETKVGEVVGCIYEVECSVGGFGFLSFSVDFDII